MFYPLSCQKPVLDIKMPTLFKCNYVLLNMKIIVVLVMSSNRYLTDTEKGQIQAYREEALSISDIVK